MNKKYLTLALLIAGLATFLTACNINFGGGSIRGTGDMVSRSIDVGDFSAIDISGNYIVTYRHGSQTALTIVMQENLFDHLDVNTRSNTLVIGSRRSFDTTTANRPRIYVYAPNLTGADFSGAVNATDWDTIEGQRFSLDISGAGNISIGLDVERLDIDASGAASITLWGTASTINIDASGALTISAGDLEIEGGSVDISGAGTVTLSTLENVNVTASGVARVRAAD